MSSFTIIYGQNKKEEKPPLRERIFFGGGFGLQFGTITDIEVSPVIGLWVLPRVAIAGGPSYRFYKDPFFLTSIYGGNAYAQFMIVRDINNFIPIGLHTGIFAQLEDELLSLESSVWAPGNTSKRFAANTVLAGGGISQMLGARASLNLAFLWPLNNSTFGLYSNPEIRLSFNF
jgi:hypothetical protein